MLDAHLIAKTRPQVRPENVVLFGDFRVSVLADRLFRIEKDEKREFCDDATEAVWFRDMAPVPFRGVRNEPKYVRYVAEKIAEIKGETVENIARITAENTRKLFNF